MTRDEAFKLRSFSSYCNCGGYAGMNGRPKNDVHLPYCAQATEWREWYDLTHDVAGRDLRPNERPV
jgi:hypothetical protein